MQPLIWLNWRNRNNLYSYTGVLLVILAHVRKLSYMYTDMLSHMYIFRDTIYGCEIDCYQTINSKVLSEYLVLTHLHTNILQTL